MVIQWSCHFSISLFVLGFSFVLEIIHSVDILFHFSTKSNNFKVQDSLVFLVMYLLDNLGTLGRFNCSAMKNLNVIRC
jgi:hypothetical protein